MVYPGQDFAPLRDSVLSKIKEKSYIVDFIKQRIESPRGADRQPDIVAELRSLLNDIYKKSSELVKE